MALPIFGNPSLPIDFSKNSVPSLDPYGDHFRRGQAILARIRLAKAKEKKNKSTEALHQELQQLEKIWIDVQSSRNRDAVYRYLRRVYALVFSWQARGRVKKLVSRVQYWAGEAIERDAEPYSVVMATTTDRQEIDFKTISKWSRALRFVQRYKKRGVGFKAFMKRHGSINGCAAQFAARLGRRRRSATH